MVIRRGYKRLIVWTLIFVILLANIASFFMMPKKAKAVFDNKWTDQGEFTFEHRFGYDKDKNLTDNAWIGIDGRDPEILFPVEYGKGNPISYWDFFDPKDHEDHLTVMSDQAYKEHIANLAKRSYTIFKIPGVETFFVITDNDVNQVKGVFKLITITDCVGDGGAKVTCPWIYYRAYSSWQASATGYLPSFILRDGKTYLPTYDLEANSEHQKSKLYQYVQSVNSKVHQIETGEKIDCAKVGSELSAEEYKNCFFPEGGRFPVAVKDNADKPPTITMSGSSFDQTKHPGAGRPALTFTLKYVLRSRTSLEQLGTNDNYFYFIATEPSYPNLAIRIQNCQTDNVFTTIRKKDSVSDDEDISGPTAVVDQKSIMDNLINKTYNNGPYKDGECPYNFIGWGDDGQLAKWGVERINRNEPELGGTAEDENCGVSGGWVTRAIASVLCSFINGIAAIAEWLTNALFKGVFNA